MCNFCILDAVQKAQGYGCAPGILGVCIGGDRATGYEIAKEQLLRPQTEDRPGLICRSARLGLEAKKKRISCESDNDTV